MRAIRPVSATAPTQANSWNSGRTTMVALAVGPLIIFYAIFLLFPLGHSLLMSLHDWPGATLARSATFVGLKNYQTALFEDQLFHKALLNTLSYVVLSIPLNLVTGLALAVLINSLPRHRAVYRVIYFLPVLVSEVASSILWRYIYQPRFGLINAAIIQISDALSLGITPPRWIEDPNLAIPSIVVMTVWKTVGYTMVILLAGLQGIPTTLYEAARVDGASGWQSFRSITLPLLRPTLMFLLMTQTIGSLQVFGPMYVMTKGGPVDATRTIVYHLYDEAFSYFRFGYASSLAVILFVIILVLTLVQARFLRQRWEY